MPGYAPRDVKVTTNLNGGGGVAFAVNALIGGAIGAGVDAYNGSALDHDPNPVVATLSPNGRGKPAAGQAHPRTPVALDARCI
ncbi:MAG: hypothetical protein JO048_04915 [Methylobacteriaceae bacterium]|nr:hypothetical protein [Methylobacteriaceae bacterium]